MKKLYSLTTSFALSLTLLSVGASAQSGGTYTTVRSGNWSATGQPGDLPVWQGSAPPSNCSNCLIQVNAGTVHLNTNVNLSNGSHLVIGSNATLVVDGSSATTFPASHSVILSGTGNESTITFTDNTSFLNASPSTDYDGVFISTPGSTPGSLNYLKYYGEPNSTVYFSASGNLQGNPIYGSTQLGSIVLSSSGTLPIILSGFAAVLNDGAVDLSWSTQLEVNSDHFAVQRSSDAGAHWAVVATVAAHGNSSTVLNYSYTDNKPSAGTSEYRLQLVDKDGRYAYSPVKTIRTSLVSAVSVYPNPARDYVNVTLGGSAASVTIRLFNQSGQLLIEKNVNNAAGTTVPLAVSGYSQGNYVIVVTDAAGAKQVSKLLISK